MSRQTTELDEALHLLEEELHAMVPADPSDGLRERVFHALSTTGILDTQTVPAMAGDDESKLLPVGRAWFGWVPVAAAAAVALMAVVIFPPKGPNSPGLADGTTAAPAPNALTVAPETTPVDWQPMASDSRLEQVAYDGVRQEESATYRQIRTRYLDRRTFRNPHDGSTVEVMLPREEIRLVPVVPE